MAYAGLARGHRTVAAAIADPTTRREVIALWDEATRHLPAEMLDLERYRRDLLQRFENARIEHRLEQIAPDATTKLRVRVVPVALAERDEGRRASACALPIGAWIALVRSGRELSDSRRDAVVSALTSVDPVRALLALLDARLAEDDDFLAEVRAVARTFE